MAHLGAGLCAGTDVALALVAAGTGNDNARELGLPRRDPEAAAALVTRVVRRASTSAAPPARSRRAALVPRVLGAGFDSVVAERAARLRWPRGPRRYEVAILLELPRFRPIPYVVTVDGERVDTAAMLVAVGNGPAFGAGCGSAPGRRTTTGCSTSASSTRSRCRRSCGSSRPSSAAPTCARAPVQVLRGRHVRLEAAGIVAQADGERVAALPLDVEWSRVR